MNEGEAVSILRASSERVGRLYPVLLDRYGNVIDGMHRLAVDPDWPKVRLNHVESKEDRIIARLVSNTCRRSLRAREKREILEKLSGLYINEGVKPGAELARKISEVTGMSFRWVMKYLPDKFKERPGIGGPSRRFNLTQEVKNLYEGKVAHRATASLQLEVLLGEPSERVLTVKKYANTNFVQVLLEKRFYANVERLAENLGTTPDIIINNVLVSAVRKLMEASNRKGFYRQSKG
jgi:hypothetical protein